MAVFDFDRAVRWARLDRPAPLRRDDSELPFLAAATAGQGLLLDTCVYIDQLQGSLPNVVDDLLDLRLVHHSSVGMAELLHAVGRLDPKDVRTAVAIDRIGAVIKFMKPHRIFEPDPDMTGRAAILAGVLSRLGNYRDDERLRAVNDCVLFLQAAKLGLTLLSRNIGDFDRLSQLVPTGRVLFYRRG